VGPKSLPLLLWLLARLRLLEFAGEFFQAHTQLLCVTRATDGSVTVATAAGSSAPATYSSATLVQPPSITSVTPLVWSTSQPTALTISGVRYIVLRLLGIGSCGKVSCLARARHCEGAVDIEAPPWFAVVGCVCLGGGGGGRFGLAPASDKSVALPMRLSGVAASPPNECGMATTPVCVLSNTSTPAYSTTRIVCTVGPGVGTRFEILIRDVWTALTPPGSSVIPGYPPPSVTEVTPAVLGTSGGQLSVLGADFGSWPCDDGSWSSGVRLLVTLPPESPSTAVFDAATATWASTTDELVRAYVPCNITLWSSTAIQCDAPPGLDAVLTIRVVVGGQVVESSPGLGYAAPLLRLITAAGPLSTCGGTELTLIGDDFPPPQWPLAVLVGGQPCAVHPASRSATRLSCIAPPGAGAVAVALRTPLQVSRNTLPLVYAPPVVLTVNTPVGRSIDGGFPVFVTGEVGAKLHRPPASSPAPPPPLNPARQNAGWACCECVWSGACELAAVPPLLLCRTFSQAPS
jgi:hypothetical protein